MASARDGPNNTIYVTAATAGNSGHTYACTESGVPYSCCSGADAGTCNTTLNGADICIGLEACETAGGCRLQIPDDTVHEAEFRIYGTPWWNPGAGVPCGGNYADGFPNGLVVQGKGIGNTILEATKEGDTNDKARSDGTWQAVVGVSNGGGLTPAEMPRVVFQDMTIDGKRELQDSTVTNQAAWYGYSDTPDEEPLRSVVIRRVRMEDTTTHLLGAGNYEAQTAGTTLMGPFQVLDSEFFGGGCHQAHNEGTSNAGMLPCGCDRTDAGADCAGWAWEVAGVGNHTPICAGSAGNCEGAGNPYACCTGLDTGPQCAWDLSACPGWVNQGSNATIMAPSNTLFSSNSFDLGLHYILGIGTTPNSCTNGFEGTEPVTPDSFGPRYCGTGVTVEKNHFYRVGSGAIDANGVWSAHIKDNIFDGDCMDDNWAVTECGDISFASFFTADVQILNNQFSNESARGVELDFWRPSQAELGIHMTLPTIRIEDNTFELDCGRCGVNPQYCEPMTITPGNGRKTMLTGDYDDDLHDIYMSGNVFQDTDATNDCVASLVVGPFEREDGALERIVGLTIDGDTYTDGGQDGSTDGWGFPGSPTANRAAAYFNYVETLRIENVTGDGKVTFGRSAGNDLMEGGCYDSLSGVTTNDRYSLTTPCSSSNSCQIPWEVPCVL